MNCKHYSYLFLLIPLLLIFWGCGSIPKDALRMNKATLEDRQLQTRVFDSSDEKKILLASSSLLQDLGFNLDESQPELGLLVSSKDRSAVEAGQVAGAMIWAALFGAYSARYDKNQNIRASVVTFPTGENKERIAVRVTFQRTVCDQYGNLSKLERINDRKIYEEFFDKLAKSIFLEAHSI